ncbi:MAG TPA: Gfo/Idh/MocA family oxidoreductase, partial [Patescibacteria group bacterium]|nr:Gfo/Idh/MocA family oxidoreductase [Patescibacteria group bacterium]
MRERIPVQALLGVGEHDYAQLARPLIRALEASHRLELDTVHAAQDLNLTGRAVVIAATDEALLPDQANALVEFVNRGGGLILIHGTLSTWSADPGLVRLAGWTASGPGLLTELVIRPDSAHPVTQRLASEWKVTDELFLSEAPPAGATVLLRARWQFTDQIAAYERAMGSGHFAFLGLGHQQATYEDATFQRLALRMVLHAAGVEAAPAVGVGLIGYGAIARDHASAIAAIPGLRLAGVCDLSAERRDLASREWSVRTHARAEEMLEDPEVGMVVVGTPPSAHAASVMSALAAGKHVVCEKPFALRVEEADRMIDTAAALGLTLTVYQSRRWDPDFIAMRDVVWSGRIGDIFYMESFIGGHSHPCDFWHSHEPISGGTIYDWGSHYFDWMLQLFQDPVRVVAASAHKRVWHDVTNADQVRVDLAFEGGRQATFLQSDIAAALKPKWYLLGTHGAVVGEWRDEAVPADFPAVVKVMRPAESGSHEEVL